jgi:hypothetical protein
MLVRRLLEQGRRYLVTEGSFAGTVRLEFDFVSGTILEPLRYTEGGLRLPLAVTAPPGIPAPTDEAKIESYFLNYLMDGSCTPQEHYRYATFIAGARYRLSKAVVEEPDCPEGRERLDLTLRVPNQVQWCIDHYRAKGFGNNHCCMTIAYVGITDLIRRDGDAIFSCPDHCSLLSGKEFAWVSRRPAKGKGTVAGAALFLGHSASPTGRNAPGAWFGPGGGVPGAPAQGAAQFRPKEQHIGDQGSP